jgi:hypothetical protein
LDFLSHEKFKNYSTLRHITYPPPKASPGIGPSELMSGFTYCE